MIDTQHAYRTETHAHIDQYFFINNKEKNENIHIKKINQPNNKRELNKSSSNENKLLNIE